MREELLTVCFEIGDLSPAMPLSHYDISFLAELIVAKKKREEADMLMAADMRYCLVGIARALQSGTDTTYLPSELAKMSERLSDIQDQSV